MNNERKHPSQIQFLFGVLNKEDSEKLELVFLMANHGACTMHNLLKICAAGATWNS